MTRVFATCFVVCPFLLLGSTADAQSIVFPAAGSLVEHYESAAKISGSTVVGVVADGSGLTQPGLGARVPASWAGKSFCVHVVSIDGRYEASQEYAVPGNWQGGVAELAFPTRYREFLNARQPNELGARIALGTCVSLKSETDFAAAGWNMSTGGLGAISLLINSFRADETYLVLDDGTEVDCVEIDGPHRTAFDTKCTIKPVPDAQSMSIELDRIKNGGYMPSAQLTISVAR